MIKFYQNNFRLGILGGGQLGRMLIQEAIDMDIRVSVLDPAADAPCQAIANEFTVGNFNDFDTVVEFGSKADVITIEIEHVNVDALEFLQSQGKKVWPSPDFLRMVQDKGLQKEFYHSNKIPTSPYKLISSIRNVDISTLQFPFVLKARTGGYDGKGVQVIKNMDDLAIAYDGPSVVEQMVDIAKEISVIVSRNESGDINVFPLVEMEFNPEANLVEFLFSPASVDASIEKEASELAKKIVTESSFVGILAVELFLDRSGKILVNEMAPRPHNSGHHTIEACNTSQYAQHLRAILDMPPGDTELIRPAVMINLLGEKGFSGPVVYHGLEEVLRYPGVHVHLYGKSETRPFRKMGHITVTADDLESAQQLARKVLATVRVQA